MLLPRIAPGYEVSTGRMHCVDEYTSQQHGVPLGAKCYEKELVWAKSMAAEVLRPMWVIELCNAIANAQQYSH